MALPGLFLVLSACIFGLNHVEATQDMSNLCSNGLEVIYPELDIDKCLTIPQNMRKKISHVWGAPKVYFPAADEKSLYVLVMVDPDAPSSTSGTYWRHWVVTDIKGSALKKGREVKGTTLTGYYPPTPPRGTGFHRYQFILYQQPAGRVMSLPGPENPPRGKWNLNAFIETNVLGPPDAAVQFRTQNYED
uniref:Phosphatidylethanolamine binding protein 4 n=2 Tax=Sphaeramia orbicularis TaxID=375764 RepID=A0A672Z8K1_9TELE